MAKIRTIAGRIMREILRKLPKDISKDEQEIIDNMKKIMEQNRDSKQKIYSIHEPEVSCISKEKKHKKYQWKQCFRRRAFVEATISHLKNDFGLKRNYLKGTECDSINLLLSAAAFNFKKLMRKLVFYFRIFKLAFFVLYLNPNYAIEKIIIM
jgi:hypothetical protein